jgi:hypothetical protein
MNSLDSMNCMKVIFRLKKLTNVDDIKVVSEKKDSETRRKY